MTSGNCKVSWPEMSPQVCEEVPMSTWPSGPWPAVARWKLEPAFHFFLSLPLASLRSPCLYTACFLAARIPAEKTQRQLPPTPPPTSCSGPDQMLSSQNTHSSQPGRGNKCMSVSESTRLQFGVKSIENHSISYQCCSSNVTPVKSLLIKTSPVNKPQALFPLKCL